MIVIFVIVIILILLVAIFVPLLYERFTQYDRTRRVLDNIKRQAQQSAMTWHKLCSAYTKVITAQENPPQLQSYNTPPPQFDYTPKEQHNKNSSSRSINSFDYFLNPNKSLATFVPDPLPAGPKLISQPLVDNKEDINTSLINNENAQASNENIISNKRGRGKKTNNLKTI